MVVGTPQREELMKMVGRTGERLGLAGEGGQISANGLVETLDPGSVSDPCEAKFLEAFLDFG